MHGYILSNHCKEMLVERNIKGNWVEETVTDPQKKENQEDDTVHYFKGFLNTKTECCML